MCRQGDRKSECVSIADLPVEVHGAGAMGLPFISNLQVLTTAFATT